MIRLHMAREAIEFARAYTLRLIVAVDPADWTRFPAGSVSNIAWQVGHLAMAEYRLVLERLRGARPEDDLLIAPEFLQAFGRDSVPQSHYPWSSAEIQATLERVHQQARAELPLLAEPALDEPPLKSHPLAKTKLECLMWCAHHEMLHAGQIGLLRRQLGEKPLW